MRRRALAVSAACFRRVDAIEILTQDHRKVQGLVLAVLTSTDATVRKQNLNQVVHDLSQHSTVEEQILYPTLSHVNSDEGQVLADRSLDEHLQVKRILEALDHMSDTSDENPTFMSTVETLSEELNKHIAEEEDQIFPLLRIRLSQGNLDHMGDVLQKMKSLAMTRPHPHVPSTPPLPLIAQLGAAFLDHLRDIRRPFPKA